MLRIPGLACLLLGATLPMAHGQAPSPVFSLSARVNHYDADRFNALVARHSVALPGEQGEAVLQSEGSNWNIQFQTEEVEPGVQDYLVHFTCLSGEAPYASVSVDLTFPNWSEENYVLLPGAAYNGNRFTYRRIRYSPKLLDPRDIGPEVPPIISDVPKLTKGPGPSRIQQRSGDMTTPSAGFWAPAERRGFWMLFGTGTHLGDYGFDLEETRGRDRATFTLTAPVVRERYKYRITDSRWPSDDVAASFQAGDTVSLRFRVHRFDAPELQGLFDTFVDIRKSWIPRGTHRLVLPFSDAFPVQEAKFNRLNWEDEYGYYSVGPRNMFLQDWQIGWTGGMISTFPLLWAGADSTRQRVLRNFDWLFPDGLAPSGLFWDSGEHGNKWYGGDIRKPHTANWHLIRKSGDGLYYVVKQLMLMERLGIDVKDTWRSGTRGVADALVNIWREAGQFGHFVDNRTGEVQVGGSTSGGIIPAALALSAAYFDAPAYLEVAEEAARFYHQRFIRKGLTMGGPGDAMQNPDSESCYALVESYSVLFETTGDSSYLEMGDDIARQFATWVISYDYPFPKTSLFGQEGMHSMGAVNANTQNKHGAPGICTHSGVGLLKLYRATGDSFYAELLQDIARNLPQYLPHPQNPIEGTEIGYMCERVSTTDWLEGIGEISYLTTWSETSLMLTYVEVPGLYVRPDAGDFVVFDNIEASKVRENGRFLELELYNPTDMPARVKVLAENAADRAQALGALGLWGCEEVMLAPGARVKQKFRK